MPAVDGDSSCVAILVEFLVKGEATEFLSLLGSDTKEVILSLMSVEVRAGE